MNRRILVYGKWLILAVFVVVAGSFCSCGRQERISLVQENGVLDEACEPGADGKAAEGEAVVSAGEKAAGEPMAFSEESGPDSFPLETKQEAGSCFVHVCGEVVNPGVYELAAGQRVYEAVGLAGGFTEEAASGWLNLAEPVRDGMKVEVPSRAQAKELAEKLGIGIGEDGSSALGSSELVQRAAGGQAAEAASVPAKVNINTAAKEELMTLRGIGEARAEDIIRYRESHGSFRKIEDIMKVSGIKDAAFQKIKENITV